MSALAWLARHGRYALVAGLVAGLLLPALAEAMRPLIAPLVVFSLFLAMLRIGPEGLRAGLGQLRTAVVITLILQVALPLAAIALFSGLGWLGHPLVLGVVLMLAAAPITGSPHIAVMIGADPQPALRQLLLGTAILPLTALPVFLLIPAFGGPAEIIMAVAGLLAMIAVAGGAAFALRTFGVVHEGPHTRDAIDSLAALTLAIVVIGLMSAVGPALRMASPAFWAAMAAAFAANFALQIVAARLARREKPLEAPAIGIVAGNRNIALFLGVLPADLAATLLLFIGCYQIPMYLTPLLLGRVLRG